MAITATTLSGAALKGDTVIGVASATGIAAPNFQTGAGITYLQIDQELFLVVGINGTFISVLRGQNGTQSADHVINSRVAIGGPSDFLTHQELLGSEVVKQANIGSFKQPAIVLSGLTDAIDPHTPAFYVVNTAGVDAMTLVAPTAADEGVIIDIWSTTANAHTLTATSAIAAGVSAKSVATFPAFAGAGIRLRACNLLWHVLSGGGSATNGGPIVLT